MVALLAVLLPPGPGRCRCGPHCFCPSRRGPSLAGQSGGRPGARPRLASGAGACPGLSAAARGDGQLPLVLLLGDDAAPRRW
eukprot:656752-Pyramimonas_sp.AAC.1